MILLVFLGNPGAQYHTTKHNIAFLIGDLIAQTWQTPERTLDKKSHALITTHRIQDQHIILAKPQSFMNLSGGNVRSLLQYYRLGIESLVVVHDDIDIMSNIIRRKTSGSSGGQNGVKDIIKQLGTDQFARIRIGIGRPSHPGADIADYVLSKLPHETLEQLDQLSEQVLALFTSKMIEQ